jgi:regulator of sirC expression with transglutaminase-like and TPR domain
LRTATPRQILLRMLHNLRGIYLDQRDLPRALGVLDRLVLLDPESWLYRRDRGLLLLQSGLLDEGIGELERYLAGEPEAPDRKEVREVICEARDQLSKVH